MAPPVRHFTNTPAPPQNDSSMSKWLPEKPAKQRSKTFIRLVRLRTKDYVKKKESTVLDTL